VYRLAAKNEDALERLAREHADIMIKLEDITRLATTGSQASAQSSSDDIGDSPAETHETVSLGNLGQPHLASGGSRSMTFPQISYFRGD